MDAYTERPRSASPASQFWARFPGFSATLRDILLVTHAVPREKAASLLPSGFVPDILPDNNGISTAFVQCLYSRMENIHFGMRPRDKQTASSQTGAATSRVTLRLLTRYNGRPSAFLLKQYVSDQTPSLPLRLAIPAVEAARISSYVAGSPLLPVCEGCDIQAVTPKQRLRLRAEPDAGSVLSFMAGYRDFTDFLTRRENLFSRWRGNRIGVVAQTTQGTSLPFMPLVLAEARLPLYEELFGLEESAWLSPVAVLWRAQETVRFDTPHLFRVSADTAPTSGIAL